MKLSIILIHWKRSLIFSRNIMKIANYKLQFGTSDECSLPVMIGSQCRKKAVLEVFTMTSLIISILIGIYVCSAGRCHEEYLSCSLRNFFGQDFGLHCLTHALTTWWSTSLPFPLLVYHIDHCRQNRIMDSIFNGKNNNNNVFPNSVGNISFNYLIVTCTVFTDCWFLKIILKTIGLESYSFVFS